MLAFILTQIDVAKRVIEPLSQQNGLLGVIAALAVVIVGGLTTALVYIVRQMSEKDKAIKELNMYIRDNDKENLKTLSEMSKLVDKISDAINNHNTEVTRLFGASVETIKSHIDLRIAEIKRNRG